ncbi:MAG TPA: TlpA family protein disulfide reductase [Phycisphaerales bacterium]|nr:TlpA family protein disulfide reductase [Phycisphaerales bacterium]
MRSLLYKIVVLVSLSVLLSGCGKSSDKISPGDTAKDFRLDTLTHKRFYLNQHKDKVVVFVFWTTWCSVCKAELVELKSLKNMPGSENLVVAGICSDPENINEVKRLAKNLNIDYPVLLDKGQTVTDRYGISAFPTTVIIDQKGVVSFVREEYNSVIANQLKTKVASLFVSDESVE